MPRQTMAIRRKSADVVWSLQDSRRARATISKMAQRRVPAGRTAGLTAFGQRTSPLFNLVRHGQKGQGPILFYFIFLILEKICSCQTPHHWLHFIVYFHFIFLHFTKVVFNSYSDLLSLLTFFYFIFLDFFGVYTHNGKLIKRCASYWCNRRSSHEVRGNAQGCTKGRRVGFQ